MASVIVIIYLPIRGEAAALGATVGAAEEAEEAAAVLVPVAGAEPEAGPEMAE